MRISPLLVAAGSLLVGVTALCAVGVVEHRKARLRKPPPEPELDETPPAPARPPRPVEAPRRRPPPSPPPLAPLELHVHVVGPHGTLPDDVEVAVHRRGADPDEWTALDDDAAEDEGDEAQPLRGTFWNTGLDPGRYDVRVQAPGMRTVRLEDVTLGPKPLEVALARVPALLGSVAGLAAGGGCGQVSVAWSGAQGEDGEEGDAAVDPDLCTFVIEELPEAGTVTVVATRGAQREAALVTVPLTGDPAFLCLAPPCPTQAASLLVYVVDGDRLASGTTLSWSLQTDGLTGEEGMSMGGSGRVWIHGQRAGATLSLRAEGDDGAVETTTSLASGITEVAVTLPRPSGWRPNCFESASDCSSTRRASDDDSENSNDHDQLRAVPRAAIPLRGTGDRDLFVSRGL